jgi:hypothetical protein
MAPDAVVIGGNGDPLAKMTLPLLHLYACKHERGGKGACVQQEGQAQYRPHESDPLTSSHAPASLATRLLKGAFALGGGV